MVKQKKSLLKSPKQPRKEPQKKRCIVIISPADSSNLGEVLNTYKKRKDISVVSDRSSLPPIALIATESFLELYNKAPGCLITPESFFIPLLLLDINPDDDRETVIKVTAELEAAREISGVWPVAVVNHSELQTEKLFLTSLHALIAQASELFTKIRISCVDEKEQRACANHFHMCGTKNPPLVQMLQAHMGTFFCEHLTQLDNELYCSWRELVSIWNRIVHLCDMKESHLLTVNRQKTTVLPNVLHWFVRGFHHPVSRIRTELETRKKSGNSAVSKFAAKNLKALDGSLPVHLRIVTNQIESFQFQTSETVNASNQPSKTSIQETHSLKDILNIQLIKPNDLDFKVDFEVEHSPAIILMPDNYSLNGELIPPEPSTEWIHELNTPYDGEVAWIGPGAVAINSTSNGRLVVCEVTDSQPMSYLSLGDSVVADQALLFTASNAIQTSTDCTENLHQQTNSHRIKRIETSVTRSMLLETALQCNGEGELFIGDLVSAEPLVPHSSELISRLLISLDKRAGWRILPLQSSRTNEIRSGYPSVIEFRRSLMRPVRRILLLLLKQFLEYDNDAVSSSIMLLNESMSKFRIVKGDIMNKEHLSILSGSLFLFTKLSIMLVSKTDTLIKPQDNGQSLSFLEERLRVASNERNPEPFPRKYQHVKEALESVDKCFTLGRSSVKLLIEFIQKFEHSLNIPVSKIELTKANYFVEKYWKKDIMKFPEKCDDFEKPGIASGNFKARGNWLQTHFKRMNTKLMKETVNWTGFEKLNQALAECRGAIEKVKILLERNEKKAKDTLEILKVCREKLISTEETYKESLSLASRTLEIMNNTTDLWEVFK